MRVIAIGVLLVLGGCGGASAGASSTGSTAQSRASSETHWREDIACNEMLPSGETECLDRGCHWQAALRCSGIEREDDDTTSHTATCACVCPAEELECMTRP